MTHIATLHRNRARWAGIATGVVVVAAIATATAAAATYVTLPMVCNQGPHNQPFSVGVTLPRSVEEGATYTIRLDGNNSGTISHFGLNYLHDMTVEYIVPTGTSYVEGSAKVVPGTGTGNVLSDVRLTEHAGMVRMRLPGRVANGSDYTPPSITLQVRATGAPGTSAVLGFNHFQLSANAFLVGEVPVSCNPVPQPYPIGATAITAPPAEVPVR